MRLSKEQIGVLATTLYRGRIKQLLTQKEIAGKAGISRRTWGKLERGEAESASPITVMKAINAADETSWMQVWEELTSKVEENTKKGLE